MFPNCMKQQEWSLVFQHHQGSQDEPVTRSMTVVCTAVVMADRDDRSVMRTLHKVCIQKFGHPADWFPSEASFHLADASMAEKSSDPAVAIVFLLTELQKPVTDQRRNSSLLGANSGVCRDHFNSPLPESVRKRLYQMRRSRSCPGP